MEHYKTAEVAAAIGIHPNTVRLYEDWGLISKPERQENGYRIFTDLHIRQIRLARTAFQIEVLQNGLRKKIIEVVKASARLEFETAVALTKEYLGQVVRERENAEEAIRIVRHILSGEVPNDEVSMKRKEVSDFLGVSMDTLRNWEMNGLLSVKRKKNGYRIYSSEDIQKLKIIRTLRCANYSLESILRMVQQLSQNPDADIRVLLNTPGQDEDIISACDRLIDSLDAAQKNARKILEMLEDLKTELV